MRLSCGRIFNHPLLQINCSVLMVREFKIG